MARNLSAHRIHESDVADQKKVLTPRSIFDIRGGDAHYVRNLGEPRKGGLVDRSFFITRQLWLSKK
jgi:hypothetical protein